MTTQKRTDRIFTTQRVISTLHFREKMKTFNIILLLFAGITTTALDYFENSFNESIKYVINQQKKQVYISAEPIDDYLILNFITNEKGEDNGN